MSAKIGRRTLAVAVFDATWVRTAVNVQIVRFIAHGGSPDNIIIRATIHLRQKWIVIDKIITLKQHFSGMPIIIFIKHYVF